MRIASVVLNVPVVRSATARKDDAVDRGARTIHEFTLPGGGAAAHENHTVFVLSGTATG